MLESADLKSVGESKLFEMWFRILGAPYRGRKGRYQLWLTVPATTKQGEIERARTPQETAEAKQEIANEYWGAAVVLGMAIKKDTDKGPVYEKLPGKKDFKDCLGAQAIIETKIKKDKNDPGRVYCEVKQKCVFSIIDPKHQKGVSMGNPPAPGEIPAAPPAATSSTVKFV